MTLKEYQSLCVKSEPKYLTRGEETLLGLLGLSSSAGQCIELYKKTLYEGAELPQEGIVEALGEVIQYVSIVAHGIDVELTDVLRRSATKLENETKTYAGDGNT